MFTAKDEGHTIIVNEGKDRNEFIITRHSQFVKPINIINVYGDVESRTSVDVIDRKWEEIMQEISKIEARDEEVILIGDMNKHLSEEKVGGKRSDHGGKLVEEFLSSGEYILVNRTDKTKGGPYTRFSPENPIDEDKKSELDLVIVSKTLF